MDIDIFLYSEKLRAELIKTVRFFQDEEFGPLVKKIDDSKSSDIEKAACLTCLGRQESAEITNLFQGYLVSEDTLVRQFAANSILSQKWLAGQMQEELLISAALEIWFHSEFLGTLAGFKPLSIIRGFSDEKINDYLANNPLFTEKGLVVVRSDFHSPVFHIAKNEEIVNQFENLKPDNDYHYQVGCLLGFPNSDTKLYKSDKEILEKGRLIKIFPTFPLETYIGHFTTFSSENSEEVVALQKEGKRAIERYKELARSRRDSFSILNLF